MRLRTLSTGLFILVTVGLLTASRLGAQNPVATC